MDVQELIDLTPDIFATDSASNMYVVLSAMAEIETQFETVVADLELLNDPKNAYGTYLDDEAEVYGLERNGFSDSDYLGRYLGKRSQKYNNCSVNGVLLSLISQVPSQQISLVEGFEPSLGYLMDGSMLMDGTWIMSGSGYRRARAFRLYINDPLTDLHIVDEISKKVRAGGVFSHVNDHYQIDIETYFASIQDVAYTDNPEKELWAINTTSIYNIDLESGEVLAGDLLSGSGGIKWVTFAGAAWVTDIAATGSLYRFDIISKTITHTITPGYQVGKLAYDGTYLYGGRQGSGTEVLKINPETAAYTEHAILTGNAANRPGIIIGETGFIYAVFNTTGSLAKISKINTSTMTVVATSTSTFSISSATDLCNRGAYINGFVYYADSSRIWKVDPTTLAFTSVYNPAGSNFFGLTSDGQHLYFTELLSGSYYLKRIDPADDSILTCFSTSRALLTITPSLEALHIKAAGYYLRVDK